MINVDKEIVVFDKRCAHHWIWEVVIGPGRIVYFDSFIDVKVMDNIKSVEHDKVENSIVEIGAAEENSLFVLNDVFSLDVMALDVVLEGGLVGLSVVLDND